MVIDVCIIISTAAIVVFVVFFVASAIFMRKSFGKFRKILHHMEVESTKTFQNVNDLAIDLREKSESLDFVFKPLSELNKQHSGEVPISQKKTFEDIADVLECVTSGIILFNKIKGGFKKNAK